MKLLSLLLVLSLLLPVSALAEETAAPEDYTVSYEGIATGVVNARIAEGKVTVEGPQVEIGGNDKYESLCWTCWREALQENGVEDIRSLISPSA